MQWLLPVIYINDSYFHEKKNINSYQGQNFGGPRGGGGNKQSQTRKIFIGGLNYNSTEESLKNHFSQYGELVDVVVMKFPDTKRYVIHRWLLIQCFKDLKKKDILREINFTKIFMKLNYFTENFTKIFRGINFMKKNINTRVILLYFPILTETVREHQHNL